MLTKIKISDKTFAYDAIAKTMVITQEDGESFKVVEVGPLQAAGLCFGAVTLQSTDADANNSTDPSAVAKEARITSVMPAKLDHWATPVEPSSQIAAIAFDWSELALRVHFHGRTKKDGTVVPGSIYRYFEVEPAVVGEVLFAPSIGTSFRVKIKSGGYKYEKEGE